ncbi:hypothetical protein KCU81_g8241, partial [Aureobasidium melanogenum]
MAMSTDTIIALVSLLVGLVGLPPTILILWHCIQRCMRPSTSHEASDVGSGVLYLAVVRDLLLTRTHRARSEIDLIIIAVYGPCHCTLKGVFPDYTLEILKVVFVTHEFVPDYRVKVGVMSKKNNNTCTYGHSQLKTGHPVRSAIHKQLNGRLVLRWVTTWESLLLY